MQQEVQSNIGLLFFYLVYLVQCANDVSFMLSLSAADMGVDHIS